MINKLKSSLNTLELQLEHILVNNKDDENFTEQISYVENEIYFLNYQIYYYLGITDSKQHIYQYNGPMYRFGKYIGESGVIETTAKTIGKAKSNILYRLKQNLDLSCNAKLNINEDKIIEIF